jgi:hypothetical protein
MNSSLTTEISEITDVVSYRPAVSIILPFEPKMNTKSELAYSLKVATNKVENELKNNYPAELATLVVEKLRSIVASLNYTTHRKSIAIYVSPVFEKVVYLDIPVNEKVVVADSFEIRDLVYSKKEVQQYLVLVISGKESKMYRGNGLTLSKIISDAPGSIHAFVNDPPERVANFSDVNKRKERVLEKFLHHIDTSLHLILNVYHLPIIVLGPEKVLGHFKNISKHKDSVIDYVHGNFDNLGPEKLTTVLAPYLEQWSKLRQRDWLKYLERAAGSKKLAVGMRNVWREASNAKGRLLLVEKDYMYSAQRGGNKTVIYMPTKPYNKFSHIKDAVDDVIEKVLESGGDVEFVDRDLLKDYHHIALIQYY